MNQRLQAAHDQLVEAVTAIVSGDDWKAMLRTAARFHKYSFFNHLLIFSQRPDATLVAGYRKWQTMNRFVRKGSKGIAILAPCSYKKEIEDPGGGDPTVVRVLAGFKIVHVFDISDTDGKPLEGQDVARPLLLEGDAPDRAWDSLAAYASEIGYTVELGDCGTANGRADLVAKHIHEIAHALVHSDRLMDSREQMEVEAESIAFIVCSVLELDSSGYSFPYVARWSNGDVELIQQTGVRVVAAAKTMVSKVVDEELVTA